MALVIELRLLFRFIKLTILPRFPFPLSHPPSMYMQMKIEEVTLFQTLKISGLSQGTLTDEYKASLTAAYLVEFPSLVASNIVFGDATVSGSRRLRGLLGRQLEIPVEIDASSVSPSSIIAGLAGDSFADNVAEELANAGEDVTIQEQKASGMELLFSVKAETTSDIENAIMNNQNFAADIAAEAVSNNAIGADALVEADADRVAIVTLTPTIKPTRGPTSVTFAPTAIECVPCDDAATSARKLLFGQLDLPCCP